MKVLNQGIEVLPDNHPVPIKGAGDGTTSPEVVMVHTTRPATVDTILGEMTRQGLRPLSLDEVVELCRQRGMEVPSMERMDEFKKLL